MISKGKVGHYGRLLALSFLTLTLVATPVFAKSPNDPYTRGSWFFDKISMKKAWDVQTSAKDVVVAVIDGPVDTDHPELKDNLWKNPRERADGVDNDGNGKTDDVVGWDFIHQDGDPSPQVKGAKDTLAFHHGTTVAGIIGAQGNNKTAISGVAWDVKIMPLQVLGEDGSGLVDHVIQAIDYAIDQEVDVINLSFVGDDYDHEFYKVVKKAYQRGIVVVAASGNDGDGKGGGNLNFKRRYPVCFDSDEQVPFLLGVAATDKKDEPSIFTNFGSGCIDVSAPGSGITSLGVHDPSNGFPSQILTGISGTSIAAPFVSGVAALIKQRHPDMSAGAVIDVIKRSADDIDGTSDLPRGSLGAGRLNAQKALELAGADRGGFGAQFVVMFDGGQWTNVRHFSHDYKKVTQFITPVPFEDIITLEIIDVNRDGVQEVVYAYASEVGTSLVAYSLEGYKIFESVISDQEVRAVGLAGADVLRNGDGGIVVGFPHEGQFKIVEYKADGDIFHWFNGGPLEKDLESVAISFSDTGFIYGLAHYGTHTVRSTWNFIGAFDKASRFDVPDGNARPVAGNGNGKVLAYGAAEGRASAVTVIKEGESAGTTFSPYGSFLGGSSVTLIDWDVDGQEEVVVGAGPGGGPHVKIFSLQGELEGEFLAHGPQYKHGIYARAFLNE